MKAHPDGLNQDCTTGADNLIDNTPAMAMKRYPVSQLGEDENKPGPVRMKMKRGPVQDNSERYLDVDSKLLSRGSRPERRRHLRP